MYYCKSHHNSFHLNHPSHLPLPRTHTKPITSNQSTNALLIAGLFGNWYLYLRSKNISKTIFCLEDWVTNLFIQEHYRFESFLKILISWIPFQQRFIFAKNPANQFRTENDEFVQNLYRFCIDFVPIWTRQINLSPV